MTVWWWIQRDVYSHSYSFPEGDSWSKYWKHKEWLLHSQWITKTSSLTTGWAIDMQRSLYRSFDPRWHAQTKPNQYCIRAESGELLVEFNKHMKRPQKERQSLTKSLQSYTEINKIKMCDCFYFSGKKTGLDWQTQKDRLCSDWMDCT